MIRRVCRLHAPAKLNLGLRIVGRRADGFHRLESLFVPLGWGDEVVIEDRGGVPTGRADPSVALSLSVQAPATGPIPEDGSNLAVRAAESFLDAAGLARSLSIALTKRIPAGAGLGGGSSDAGAVLRGLDSLLPGHLAPGRLAEIALSIGADVPFFLSPGPSLVSGIGEQREPVAGLRSWPVVLANPGILLATADVYRAFEEGGGALTGPGPGSTMRAVSGLLADTCVLASGLRNDLEPAAIGLCPGILPLLAQLERSEVVASGMSGSGATVFGIFEDEAAAGAARSSLELEGPAWALQTQIAIKDGTGASPNW